MSTLVLDACLILALLGVIGLTAIRGDSWGPEGPVGLFVLVLPVLLLIGGVLAACTARGLFDWAPGGRLLHYAAVLGVVVGLGTVILLALDRNQPWWSHICALLPFLVIAAAAATLHSSSARTAVAGILGVLAVTGWIVTAGGFGAYVRSSMQEAEQRAQLEQQRETERSQEDLAAFRTLASDASVRQLVAYAYSPNDAVQKEARGRIAARPNLDEELSAMLLAGAGDNAASYIAHIHPAPSAKLAPAFASFLEAELPGWQSRLTGSPNPGSWQPNISSFFDGADRIQKAGGDLRPQLKQWHDYLKTVSGMNGMVMHIAPMLR
jgi:hypothetical protein